MPQSLADIRIHLTFSAKDRIPFLKPEFRPKLHAYASSILAHHGCTVILINSVVDHMHLFYCLGRTLSLAKSVEEVKKSTSKWVKLKDPSTSHFAWQNGYGAFSVSRSQSDRVERYIANQEAHHRKTTFQEEFRKLLERHGISYDERYVWG